jgi:hypothetical protein
MNTSGLKKIFEVSLVSNLRSKKKCIITGGYQKSDEMINKTDQGTP